MSRSRRPGCRVPAADGPTGLSLSVVVRYVVLPAVVLGLVSVWHLRREGPLSLEPARADRAVWWLIAAFAGVYVTMSALRYLAYRTTI